MKSQFFPIVLLVSVLASFFLVQMVGSDAVAAEKGIIYQATWQSDNVKGELYVNGFIIEGFQGSQSAGGFPLNPLLIGKNEIWAKVRKADTSILRRIQTAPGRYVCDKRARQSGLGRAKGRLFQRYRNHDHGKEILLGS
jgi:hypothetical protein